MRQNEQLAAGPPEWRDRDEGCEMMSLCSFVLRQKQQRVECARLSAHRALGLVGETFADAFPAVCHEQRAQEAEGNKTKKRGEGVRRAPDQQTRVTKGMLPELVCACAWS